MRSIILFDFKDNCILVSDRFICLLIDTCGHVITKIGERGQGPGEYNLITSIKFGLNDHIYLQDGLKILVYDLHGNYIRKFIPEVNPDLEHVAKGGLMKSWDQFNDSLFIGQICNDSGKEKFKAVFFDSLGQSVHYIHNYRILSLKQPYLSSNNSDASIYSIEGKIYFKEKLSDTIFLVSDDLRLIPKYYIDLGKYKMPDEVFELPLSEIRKVADKYISIQNVFETTNNIFLDCYFNNHNPARRPAPEVYRVGGLEVIDNFYHTEILGIYNKDSRKIIFAEPKKSDNSMMNDGLKNDYDGGVNFYPRESINDSTLVMWVDAYELKLHVASKAFKESTPKYPEKKKELQELANGLSDSDNPVMVFCTFKQ